MGQKDALNRSPILQSSPALSYIQILTCCLTPKEAEPPRHPLQHKADELAA